MKGVFRVSILSAAAIVGLVGLIPGAARDAFALRGAPAAVGAGIDATTDWPILVAFDITPKTLKNNRVNVLKLTFRFQDDGKNLLGGKLDLKIQYSQTSLPLGVGQRPSRAAAAGAAIDPPLYNWPTAWTYPLTQSVFNNATGTCALYFDFLGETWTWAKITATLTDRKGHKGAARQITLQRSKTVIGPEQGSDINDVAYTFTLLNQNRKQIKLSSYMGKVVLTQFSFWNCEFCQQEASNLEALYQKYKAQGFQALTVMIWNDKNQPMLPEDCLKWAQIFGLTTPVLADLFCGVWDPYLRDTHGYSAPNTFLIDRVGKIRAYYAGFSPMIKSKIEAKIKKLLAEEAGEGRKKCRFDPD